MIETVIFRVVLGGQLPAASRRRNQPPTRWNLGQGKSERVNLQKPSCRLRQSHGKAPKNPPNKPSRKRRKLLQRPNPPATQCCPRRERQRKRCLPDNPP